MFAAGHCVNPASRHEGEICFAVRQQLRQYTFTLCIHQCHMHNFNGICACESEPALQFSAFLAAVTLVEISITFKDFNNEIRGLSMT